MKHTMLAVVTLAMALFGSTLENPVYISPDSGATNIPTISVELKWHSVEGAETYAVQWGTNSNSMNTEWVNDTALTIDPFFPNTDFVWRVTAQNDSSWSVFPEYWTFTTGDNAPNAPILVSPVNNLSMGIQPILTWKTSSGATEYEVQLATDTGFTNLLVDENTGTDTTYQTSGLSDLTEYYWRARASNNTSPSIWTPRYAFKMITPQTPQILFPAEGEIQLTDTLRWSSAYGAETYMVQITKGDFQLPTIQKFSIQDTFLVVGSVSEIEFNTSYKWRVQGWNSQAFGSFSDSMAFSIGEEPLTMAVPVAPPDNTEEVELTDTLKWSSTNGEGYIVEIDTTDAFGTSEEIETSDTTLALETLSIDRGITYYWRVKTYKGTDTTAYSSTVSFTTRVPTHVIPRADVTQSNIAPQAWVVDVMGRKIMKTNRIHQENLPKGCYLLMAPNKKIMKNLHIK